MTDRTCSELRRLGFEVGVYVRCGRPVAFVGFEADGSATDLCGDCACALLGTSVRLAVSPADPRSPSSDPDASDEPSDATSERELALRMLELSNLDVRFGRVR